uniref:Uncharacterized protein n=1 Tax=Arundo donax TaxID=35708 RepID=A0A0A9FD88_ARUDO
MRLLQLLVVLLVAGRRHRHLRLRRVLLEVEREREVVGPRRGRTRRRRRSRGFKVGHGCSVEHPILLRFNERKQP